MRTVETNTTEKLIRAGDVQALKWLPRRRGGGRLNVATVYRWITSGVRGVKLRAVRAGETWCTRESWLEEFFAAIAQAEMKLQAPTDSARQKKAETALRRARAM